MKPKRLVPKAKKTITLDPKIDTQMRLIATIEGLSDSALCEKAIAQYLQLHQDRIIEYFQNQFKPVEAD